MSDEDHSEEWGDQPTIRFFPDHITSEATAVILLLCLYTVLAIFFSAHLDIKADPAVTPEGSKPEWYFMFLFGFLHFVPPLVGTLVPAVAVGFLIFLPWIDRNPSRAPKKRVIALSIGFLIMVGILVLSYVGATA